MWHPPILAALGLCSVLGAQQLSEDEVRARRDAGKPLWEVKWKVDDDGTLWMSPSPSSGDDDGWQRFDGGDLDLLGRRLANMGGWTTLCLLLTGPRDLASLGDAELVLRAGGRDVSDAALRQLAATPVTAETEGRARRAALERILAVRLLQERRTEAAQAELRAIARDAGADPFLVRAAQDALLHLAGTPRPRAAAAVEAVRRLPAGADLIFFVDQTRVPPPFFLPRLARAMVMHALYDRILQAGGALSPAELAGGQYLADTSSRFPFEIARRFGNGRVDWTLGALAYEPRRVALWVEAEGLFELDRIRAALTRERVDLEEDGGVLRTNDLPHGIALRLDQHRVHLESPDLESRDDPDRAARLRQLGLGGDAAIWVHVPPGSGLLEKVDLPAVPEHATLEVAFGAGITVTLRTEHGQKLHARAIASLLTGLRDRTVRQLEDAGEGGTVDRAIAVLKGATAIAEGTLCTARVEVAGITEADLRALLPLLDQWQRR